MISNAFSRLGSCCSMLASQENFGAYKEKRRYLQPLHLHIARVVPSDSVPGVRVTTAVRPCP